MNRKFLLLCVACLPGLIIVGLLGLAISAQASTGNGLFDWNQVNSDGFGIPSNGQIPSLAVFKDYLYAGTQNYGTQPNTAQVWRTSNGTDWFKVDDRVANACAAMQVYKDYLYCGSWDGKIWRTQDGTSWGFVIQDGFGNPVNGIARFAVYSDTLYAGTWSSTGTEIWRTSDGLDWEQFGLDGINGNLDNGGMIATEEFDGYLYLGVGNWITGAQVWRTDGITLTAIITGGFGITQNASVSALAAFGDHLYASLWSSDTIHVWRSSNGADWVHVINNNIGGAGVKWENALVVYNGWLYLALTNEDTGAEVWRTPNGDVWEQVGFSGFGDANNTSTYWDNASVVFKDSLYVAMRNVVTGGEIWRLTLPARKLFLPAAWR
jgi:hypothetical protein